MEKPSMGQFMQPEAVATHFHFREGDSVADFGAGPGNFTRILSKMVGSTGRVYACEIQKALVDKLGILIHSEHLSNTEVIWCDLEAEKGTKLADGVLDAGILINTLFQLENKKAALTEMARVIRKGGKFFVVDWSESFGGMGPQLTHVMSESDCRLLAEDAGFAFERVLPAGDHHYGLGFRRI